MALIKILAALFTAVALAGCGSQPKSASSSADIEVPAGMQAITGTGLDAVHIAPGVDFADYRSFYIEPVAIQYDPTPRADSLHRGADAFRLDQRDLETLRGRYQRALTEVLEARLGWEPVDRPGPGVVTLRSELRDFYLYASLRNDLPQSSQTLTGESSRFTVLVQAVDSATGQVLLQSSDRRVTGDRGASPGNLRHFSAVRYWSDFRQDIDRWARRLSDAMSAAAGDRGA